MRKKYSRNKYKEPLDHVIWLKREDKLYKFYEEYKDVFNEGKIYFSHIVHANAMLFDNSEFVDCPAVTIYSTDDWVNANPECMKDIVRDILSYRQSPETDVPEKYKSVVAEFVKDSQRINHKFELEIEGHKAMFHIATILVYRTFLPDSYLSGSILPVIAEPDKYETVIVLPHKYWAKDFKKDFMEESE